MYDYVPFIQEEAHICSKIDGKQLSVIFDGTSHLGEALAVDLLFISREWSVEQRFVRVQMLSIYINLSKWLSI